MSIADIKKVRDAETNAANIRKQAEVDAAQIIADGKKEAKDLLDKANKDAESYYKAQIEQAESQAAAAYDEIIKREQSTCEKIKEGGRAKIGGVVDDIVRKVVSI